MTIRWTATSGRLAEELETMVVMERIDVIEVYGELYGPANRDEFDRSIALVARSPDDPHLNNTRLIARIFEDGTCTDPRGQAIDSASFLMAYQVIQASRSAATGRKRPGRVYFSPIESEYLVRFGVTADLISAIEPERARDWIISLLFATRQFEQLEYIASMVNGALQDLELDYGFRERCLMTSGLKEVTLTLPDDYPTTLLDYK